LLVLNCKLNRYYKIRFLPRARGFHGESGGGVVVYSAGHG
jgi:hypothetical protein